ncbi:MAG TPA: hypothetical protein VFH48_20385 [Chloroflexota bacterium]|nr:hypothetical protein [Chloroflexota bacterium]
MRTLRSSLLCGLMAAFLLATPVTAAPAGQAPEIDVTPARLSVYPLGTARVQMVLTNPTNAEQIFALEILLVRSDGSISTAYLTEALSLAPGVTATAIYAIRHAEGAVEAVVTPRRWPELTT